MGPVTIGFTHSYVSPVSCQALYDKLDMPESLLVLVNPLSRASGHVTITVNRAISYPRLHVMVDHTQYRCRSHWEVTSSNKHILDVAYYHMERAPNWTENLTFDADYLRLITTAIVRCLNNLADPFSLTPLLPEPVFDFVWDL